MQSKVVKQNGCKHRPRSWNACVQTEDLGPWTDGLASLGLPILACTVRIGTWGQS